MRLSRPFLFSLFFGLIPYVGAADGLDRVLFPVAAQAASGAHGSRWTVDTRLLYTGHEVVEVRPRTYICIHTCDSSREAIPPGLPPRVFGLTGATGLFLYLPEQHADEFVFQSVVYDSSGAYAGARTAVPVVRECEFRPSAHLLDVALGDASRVLIRIYGVPEAPNPVVTVRYRAVLTPDLAADVLLLREETLYLATPRPTSGGLFLQPAFVAIPHIGTYPELAAYDHVWIEIAAASPGLRVWAMASITDNVTQHVTLVYPQVPCDAE